jgi:hypothetical protein
VVAIQNRISKSKIDLLKAKRFVAMFRIEAEAGLLMLRDVSTQNRRDPDGACQQADYHPPATGFQPA